MNIQNKRAYFNFEIVEKLEAGIVLSGNEVKSIRAGQVTITEAYIIVKSAEVFINNMIIQPYTNSNTFQPIEINRLRKLLLHKKEISRLIGKVQEKGLTIVPLSLYFKKNVVKLCIGLAKGKHTVDKRETIKKRESDREIARTVKNYK
ncbi:MAG: SsrA-binding protein [Candidatus Margulisbacteria bacterium GWF2_35_9]|nr:MAG: SsrA-binding protein [Candidatus Margulisbacteria bacterium GWF2_35_9]